MGFSEIITAIIIATVAFLVKELISLFVLSPLDSYNDLRGRIIDALVRYSRYYTDPVLANKLSLTQNDDGSEPAIVTEYRIAAKEIRALASSLYGFIPRRYPCLGLFGVPSRKKLIEIGKDMILISNFQVAQSSFEAIVNAANNTKKTLGLDEVKITSAKDELSWNQ